MTTLIPTAPASVTTITPGASPSLDDVRTIIGERRLIELALQAVEHHGADLPLWLRTREPALSTRMLLALLTYSYAAGIFAAEDICAACRRNPGLHYLAANTWPDERSLRRFRRLWPAKIESCLRWIYTQVASELGELAVEPGPDTNTQFKRLAGRKLKLAMLMDLESSG